MLEYRKLLNNAIQETERDKIFHVGFSVKKERLPDFVQQNNIQDKNYKVIRRKSFQLKKAQFQRQQSQINYGGDDEQQIRDLQEESPRRKLPFSNVVTTASINKRFHSKMNSQLKTPLTIENEDYHSQDPDFQPICKSTARKILHPTLEDEYLGSKKVWVPGYLSKERFKVSNTPGTHRSMRTQTLRNYTDSLI